MKTWEAKEKFADNHVHNNLRIFDGWAILPFTTSEMKLDY